MAEITLEDIDPDFILFLLDYYGLKMEVFDEDLSGDVKIIRVTSDRCQVDQAVALNTIVGSKHLGASIKAGVLNAIRNIIAAPYKLELDELKVKLENCHAELEKVYGPRWPDLEKWHNL